MRINRYMLECKYGNSGNSTGDLVELIDTCWNVNIADEEISDELASELIDTCWNVNAINLV